MYSRSQPAVLSQQRGDVVSLFFAGLIGVPDVCLSVCVYSALDDASPGGIATDTHPFFAYPA